MLTSSGQREQIIFDNFEWIKDVCSRLDRGVCLWWEPGNQWTYKKESKVIQESRANGTAAQLAEVLGRRPRGKRLVCIVAHGGTLYEFV